jgi:hypothetical protein
VKRSLLIDPKSVTSSELTAKAKPTAGRDIMPLCRWCSRQFVPRETGGHDQRFCGPACRRALHSTARRWALAELAAGRLPLTAIKNGLPATRALATEAAKPPSAPEAPEAGGSGSPKPPNGRFTVVIHQSTVRKLLQDFQIAYNEKDNVITVLDALIRSGRRPASLGENADGIWIF